MTTQKTLPNCTYASKSASLLTIPVDTQVLISSFLDYKSIICCKHVCLSISSIMKDQLGKIDVKVLNIHQLINNKTYNNGVYIMDILNSGFEYHRIRKSDKIKSFTKYFDIDYENLICFKQKYSTSHGIQFDYVDNLTTFNDVIDTKCNFDYQTIKLIVADQNLLYDKNMKYFEHLNLRQAVIFVQQFNVETQTLRIDDIIVLPYGCQNFLSSYKKYTIDRKKKSLNQNIELTFYEKQFDWFDRGSFYLEKMSDNGSIVMRRNIQTLFYEIKGDSNHDLLNLKQIFNQQLEPFCQDINQFYIWNWRSGLKYNQLGLEFHECDEYENAHKCFEKAYNLDPEHSVYCYNYLDSLIEMCEYRKAQKICLKKLKLYEEGKFNIVRGRLYEYYYILAKTYMREEYNFDESLKYFYNAIREIFGLKQSVDELPHDLTVNSLDDKLFSIYDQIEFLCRNEKYKSSELSNVSVEFTNCEEFFNDMIHDKYDETTTQGMQLPKSKSYYQTKNYYLDYIQYIKRIKTLQAAK
eukprot:191091_1